MRAALSPSALAPSDVSAGVERIPQRPLEALRHPGLVDDLWRARRRFLSHFDLAVAGQPLQPPRGFAILNGATRSQERREHEPRTRWTITRTF
jgi:hypothetical protein